MYLKEVSAISSETPINNTLRAAEILKENFADADREYFVSVNLDSRGRPISYHVVGIGSVGSVHFGIANIFKIALLQNARSVILCHNHPGGCVEASDEDIDATKTIVSVGKSLDIPVLDHFILTADNYVSLREENREIFT